MLSSFDLISSDNFRLTLRNVSLNYVRQIKNEIVLVTVISSTDDQNQLALLSSMTNLSFQDSNSRGVTFYTSNLKKRIQVLLFYLLAFIIFTIFIKFIIYILC